MTFPNTEEHILGIGTLAPLARFGAIFGANTLHLGDRQIKSLSYNNSVLTFAARQTVHALAPRITGGFLWRYRSGE